MKRTARRQKLKPSLPINVVGPRMRELRKQRGWTQVELAEELCRIGHHTTRDQVVNWELRRCAMFDVTVMALAVVFGVRVRDLYPPFERGAENGEAWRNSRVGSNPAARER